MPRAPFDTTCDIFAGPATANPNALKATVNCRLVLQTGIFLMGPDNPVRVAWITMKDHIPVGSWSNPQMGFRPSLADRIAVPSAGFPQWWTLYVEEVFWKSQPAYYRANVAFLPAPPDGGGPGGGGGGGPWSIGSVLLHLRSESTLTPSMTQPLVLGSASTLVVSSPQGPLIIRNEP